METRSGRLDAESSSGSASPTSILRSSLSTGGSCIGKKRRVSFGPTETFVVETEHSAPEVSPLLQLVPRSRPQRLGEADLILQTWNAPASTPELAAKRPRAMWSIDDKIVKYALREPDRSSSSSPSTTQEETRPQAPSPPAKRVRATRPDGAPLLPDGWREEVRNPASGRVYRVYLGPEAGQIADSRVKAWEAFERAKQGLPFKGTAPADDAKRKRGAGGRARVCLACDLGRKRRCTCGKRTRKW